MTNVGLSRFQQPLDDVLPVLAKKVLLNFEGCTVLGSDRHAIEKSLDGNTAFGNGLANLEFFFRRERSAGSCCILDAWLRMRAALNSCQPTIARKSALVVKSFDGRFQAGNAQGGRADQRAWVDLHVNWVKHQ